MKNKSGFFKVLEQYREKGGEIYGRQNDIKKACIRSYSNNKEQVILLSENLCIAISVVDEVITVQFRFENLDDLDTTIGNIKEIVENNSIYKFGDVVNSANFFSTKSDKNTLLLDTLSENLSVWFRRKGYDFYVSFKESTSGLLDLEEIITTGCRQLMEQEI